MFLEPIIIIKIEPTFKKNVKEKTTYSCQTFKNEIIIIANKNTKIK